MSKGILEITKNARQVFMLYFADMVKACSNSQEVAVLMSYLQSSMCTVLSDYFKNKNPSIQSVQLEKDAIIINYEQFSVKITPGGSTFVAPPSKYIPPRTIDS